MPDLQSQLRWYYESLIRLRDPGDVVAGRAGGVKVTQELGASPGRRWWQQPAVVATTAAVLALVIGGGAMLGLRLWGGGHGTDETTNPATPAQWSYPASEVPPFHATVAWDRNPESTWRIGYQGSTATVDLWYESPLRFRWQLVELDADLAAQGLPAGGAPMGGPGSAIVGDGEKISWYSAADGQWSELEAWPSLDRMFWESAGSSPPGGSHFDWAGQCRDHASTPTTEPVAGRNTYHIVCTSPRGDWDLWVDSQTGLVLKMRGETDGDDLQLGTSPAGGFEVTSLDFFEGAIPGSETLFALEPSEGLIPSTVVEAVPPLHVVIAVEGNGADGEPVGEWDYTEEIWYRDPQTWRVAGLTASGPVGDAFPGAGGFWLLLDGVYTGFAPKTYQGFGNAYWVDESGEQHPPEDAIHELIPIDQYAITAAGTSCSQVGIESVLGRPASHTHCEGASYVRDSWVDVETGLQLKTAYVWKGTGSLTRRTTTVLSIEVDPVFPDDTFTFTPEPGWCNLNDPSTCTRDSWGGTGLTEGQAVPTFSGPLTDGTPFDLANLRGRSVVVFLWWDDFEPGVLERLLSDFEALYLEWGDRVAFVSVPNLYETDARRFVERMPLTHPVVTCFAASIPQGQDSNGLCAPDSPDTLWRVGPFWTLEPAWVIVDAEGRAGDLLRGEWTTYETLNQMIANAVG